MLLLLIFTTDSVINYNKEIQKVIKIKDCELLTQYIDINDNYGTNPKLKFEKEMYKLLNNLIFGKINQNNRKNII